MEDPNKKRTYWSLAKIIELIPDKDGLNRLAHIKVDSIVLLRPIHSTI